MIEIRLRIHDAWSYNWQQQAWFDNVTVYDAPPVPCKAYFDERFNSLQGWQDQTGSTYDVEISNGVARIYEIDGFCVDPYISHAVNLSGWSVTSGPMYLEFDRRAKSDYGGGVTNAYLDIYDAGTCLGTVSLTGGGTDTGWQHSKTNITQMVANHSMIEIRLRIHDAWSYNWQQQAWFDNVTVYDPYGKYYLDVGDYSDDSFGDHNPGICILASGNWSERHTGENDETSYRHTTCAPAKILLNVPPTELASDWKIIVHYMIINGGHGEFQQYDGTCYKWLGFLYGDGQPHTCEFVAPKEWFHDVYNDTGHPNVNAMFRFDGYFSNSLQVYQIWADPYNASPTGSICEVGGPIDDQAYYHNPGIHIEPAHPYEVNSIGWSPRRGGEDIDSFIVPKHRLSLTTTPRIFSNIDDTASKYELDVQYSVTGWDYEEANESWYLGPTIEQWTGEQFRRIGRLYTSGFCEQSFMLDRSAYYDWLGSMDNTNILTRFTGGPSEYLKDKLRVYRLELQKRTWPLVVGIAYNLYSPNGSKDSTYKSEHVMHDITCGYKVMGWDYPQGYSVPYDDGRDRTKEDVLEFITQTGVFIFCGHGWYNKLILKTDTFEDEITQVDLEPLGFQQMKFVQLNACHSHDEDFYKCWIREWQGNGATGGAEACLSVPLEQNMIDVEGFSNFFYDEIAIGHTVLFAYNSAVDQYPGTPLLLEGNPEVTLAWPGWGSPCGGD